jgi:hypothetical protein
MNTSTNTNLTQATTKVNARTTPVGFRRRTMAGTLLVTALTAVAVGFAAASHADDAPNPGPDMAIVVPAPPAIPVPPPVAPWLEGLLDRALQPHLHCGVQRADRYHCAWW